MAGETNPVGPNLTDGRLTTVDAAGTFEGFIKVADTAIEKFLTEHTEEGGALNLSSADSLKLQQLMSDQSIAAQTGTSTLKAVKDNIVAAARNI
ncbi:hypothetical protein F1E07_26345 [Escherichia coli]|uniref:Uncharacterized protein n=1 Tax=Photorhabdus australis subsp. thailandensis TaxID=2805096 RepID=A0A1C0U4Q6_9GAMM|nr:MULTISPECIES: hypothetical protein [Enterobacterales]KAA1446922.1 hypothetical protein F1E07_26345 [Escherichia coli]OCQ52866.1 hypothetical protein Ppb6_01925 [Photorhabdus australis subsp. thailandensis]